MDARTAHDSLCRRVMEVAALHQRCAITSGSGRLVWMLGLPLLLLIGAEMAVGLPFYLRAPILPGLAIAFVVLAWKYVIRAFIARYSTTRAALLVEEKRPELQTRLVSAIELYHDLEADKPRFDRGLVHALVVQTQLATQTEDFCAVVDRSPAKRQTLLAVATLIVWGIAFALNSSGIGNSLHRMVAAWSEVRQLAEKASGARIVITPLGQPAFLVGSDVSIRAEQQGFHSDEMTFHYKAEDEAKWNSAAVSVTPNGQAEHLAKQLGKTIECYFVSGHIQSERLKVLITERPRIVNLKVETELPQYARRAPVIEPHSDGHLREKLFGSTVTLTLEANKKLKTASLKRTSASEAESMVVGGNYARIVLRLNNEQWLTDEALIIKDTYTLRFSDDFGFSNDDESHPYDLSVIRDQAPTLALVGLPNRSSADEPHVLEQSLGGISAVIRAKDDFGISRVTVYYRVESLETNAAKHNDSRARSFTLPQADIQQLSLLRLSETDAKIGDRIVLWAEAEDAYDLEPAKGPHKVKTPVYKIAVVTREEMFENLVNRDTWSPVWYDELKRAALPGREVQVRTAPEAEAAAKVAAKLLNAPQMGDSVRQEDQQLIQDYFNSLSITK